MASTVRSATMLRASSMAGRAVARRSMATLPRTRPGGVAAANATKLPKNFRRGYADVKLASPVVEAKPPKRFRTLKWLWRATYITIIGGVVYMGYGVYELRHPDEQPTPDPNKQTLVILGKFQVN